MICIVRVVATEEWMANGIYCQVRSGHSVWLLRVKSDIYYILYYIYRERERVAVHG